MSKMSTKYKDAVLQSVELIGDGMDTAFSIIGLPLPICNIIKDIVKFGKSIYDVAILNKLLYFLDGANYNKPEDKCFLDNFLIKRVDDPKFEISNGELLLDYLNKTDDRRKAKLIGKVYSYCVKKKIDSKIFFQVVFCINASYYYDLFAITLFDNADEQISCVDERLDRLCFNGFLYDGGIDAGGASDDDPHGNIYSLNKYGKILKYAIKDLQDNDN